METNIFFTNGRRNLFALPKIKLFSPISLISRLFGKEFLDLKTSSLNRSYWNYKDNDSISHQNYEKQF